MKHIQKNRRYSNHFVSVINKLTRLCRYVFLCISSCFSLYSVQFLPLAVETCMHGSTVHTAPALTHKGPCTFKLSGINMFTRHYERSESPPSDWTNWVTEDFVKQELGRACCHTHLMEYKTLPFLNILSSLLSVVTSWKWAPFSLAKNRSGFHMESNMEGSRSRESSGYSE